MRKADKGSQMRKSKPGTSRRQFLRRAATVAVLAAARAAFPFGASVAWAAGPETKKAALGYIALTDSAPLIVAQEKGFFAKYGMTEVDVAKQASWGATRDNLVLGSEGNGIDGAHILTPMPYLMTEGKITQNGQKVPMSILARLNLDAQAISISKDYAGLKIGADAGPLKSVFAARRAAGKDAVAAMTFPGGTHDLWIRYWLAAGGIDPDKDLQLIVVPPPQMVANMKVGSMDLFCVGEPWNAQLVNQGIGYTAVNTGEIWAKHPEKSFALRSSWVDKNPAAAQALLMAVMDAQQWCDKAENKDEMAKILGTRAWFNVPAADILPRAKGEIDYGLPGKKVAASPHLMKYWRDDASFPWRSHDQWFLAENMRWGKLEAATDTKALIDKVNRSDLWRLAAKDLGVTSIPDSDSRGKETFFDGKVFDPANPGAYLASLDIKRFA
jgi:nitrate/nitrite transport system substrate-binding protein